MSSIKNKLFIHKRLYLFSWIGVLIIALLFRTIGLGFNPVGISHDDELNELLNAKSSAIAGEPRPGFVAGILTQNDQCKFFGDCVYGELGTYLQAPWQLIFPLDLAISRIFFVLVSLAMIFVTGKLFENFSQNKTVGVLTGLFIALNPWAIYYGRTTHTILLSHLFYILAAFFFTRRKSHKYNLIFGFLTSFIASLVYFGSKSILPLVILWGIIYSLYQFKFRNLKFTALFIFLITIIIGGYFLLLSNSFAGKRLADVETIETTNKGVVIELGGSWAWAVGRQVDKITPRISSLLGFFDIDSLFLTGQQASDNYYLSSHGYFYLIDLAFLILGLMAVSAKPRKAIFALLLIVIAVFPAAIKLSETSIYSHRVSLAYPLLSGLMAWGLYYLFHLVPKKSLYQKVFILLITFIYSISVGYYQFVYWYRSPVNQSARWFFHERALASYITRMQKAGDERVILVSARPDGIFNSYVFYSGNYNKSESIKEINKGYANRNYEYDNAIFTDDCAKISSQDLVGSIIIIDQINNPSCAIDLEKTNRIANPKDAGVIYKIKNDFLCEDYTIGRHPQPRSILDFKVEDQSDEVFCNLWISNPDVQ